MTSRIIATILFFSILSITLPLTAFGLGAPDSGSTSAPNRLVCKSVWAKIICVVKKVADAIKSIFRVKKVIDSLPHSFPFGGHILTSERACSVRFDSWTRFINPLCFIGFCFPPTVAAGPIPITIPLGGRAIRVGEPVPIVPPTTSPYGRAIIFPWISDVYRNHQEKRVGPWALGLGFTPFPLKDINGAISSITIWVPPQPFDPPCGTIYGRLFLPLLIGFEECLDNFRFECLDSGEFDKNGNPIYKVIRKLGTSP